MSTAVSYQTIEAKLQTLHETTSAQEFGYDLLRIFNAMSETKINRIKEGKDNLLKTENTFLSNKTLAYCWCKTIQLATELEYLKNNAKVTKAAPRLLVVSDGVNVLAYDPKEKESYDNEIAKIRFDYQFFMPLAGVERYQAVGEEEADVKAAYKMARIFDEIRRYNEIDYKNKQDIHALNVFMSRLLFCFFAEDTDIFKNKIFTNAIKSYTLEDGSDVGNFLDEAFDIMSTNSASIRAQKSQAIRQFPYVNGGLFSVHYTVPTLGWKARRLLLECGVLNWDKINPDIFGSMIQAVISPELRSSLGLHYTSVSNIMKVIQPLFLDELYAEFASARNNEKQLRKLLIRISKIKFFDPACGSGNFLIIIYKELRKLEIQIWQQLEKLSGERIIPFSNIQLTQFYGIELDEYAQETAILSLWLAEHQMNKEFEDRFHIHVDALPLRSSGNIVKGNACRLDWNTVCPHSTDDEVYIMGNPPYLGSSIQNKIQKDDMAYVFDESENYKKLDYITCWFFLASKYISNNKAKCAFVATNSITQGEQVPILWPKIFENNIEIYFAYTSFMWKNNAKYNAMVAVSIIGLKTIGSGVKRIYENDKFRIVTNINPYIIDADNIFITGRSTSISNFPEMIKGCAPVDDGNLLLSQDEYERILNNYPQSKQLIKKYIGADEFVNGKIRYCLWITESNKNHAYSIPELSKRFLKCKEFRENSKKESTRKIASVPYLFDERKYQELDSIVVPQTGSEKRKYLPIGLTDKDTVLSNAVRIIYGGDVVLFGIVISYMHMVWVRTVAGRLKTDMQYSNTICYNTFPFPKISETKRAEIEQAAEDVLLARQYHTEKTLAEMYDPKKMPTNLRQAHTMLDRLVESCYRPEPFHSDEERLEHLFALYEKMTKKK